MVGTVKTGLALLLTIGWLLFLVGGWLLSSFPAGLPITEEQFADPGFAVDGKLLYLGSSNRGSDLLSDLVSATWFNTWTCAAATIVSLLIAYPVWRLVNDNLAPLRFAGLVTVRISCAFTLLPPFMLIAVTDLYYPAAPFSLIALLAFYAFPFGVHLMKVLSRPTENPVAEWQSVLVFALRRWAALHMLVAVLGFMVSLRSVWPGDLIEVYRANVVLLMFGAWIPFVPVAIFTAMALCLRLWASALEERWSIAPISTADNWVFLPTILERDVPPKQTVRQTY